MTLANALLTRQRVLEAKIESSPGVAESLTPTQGVFNIMDAKLEPTIPAVEREGQGSLSPLAPVPGARMGKATFKSELVGSGTPATDPYWATVFLTACGFPIASHVAKPQTGSAATATIGHFLAGRFYEIAGAMGKFTLNGENGKPAVFDWEFDGVWQPPTSVALPTPAYPSAIPPRVAACTFTIGSVTYQVPKVELAVDNTLYLRPDITTVSGYAAACIVNRKITVKVDPEALPLTSQDWFAAHLASSGVALNLVIGGTAGNMFTIAAPNLVLLNPPGYADREGLLADSLEFLAVRSSSGGDDEMSLTIG